MKPIFFPFVLLIFCFQAYPDFIKISTEKTNFLPYEPVYLHLYYSGKQDVVVNPELGNIELLFINGTTQFERKYIPIAHYDVAEDNNNMPANFESVDIVPLTFDKSGWIFESPGSYYIKAKTPDGSIESEPIIITIKALDNMQDISIANRIKTCEAFGMFVRLEGGDMFEDAFNLTKSIAEGNSSYKYCMQELLIKAYSQRSVDKKGKFREPDLNAASQCFYGLQENRDDALSRCRSLAFFGRAQKANQDKSFKGKHNLEKVKLQQYFDKYKINKIQFLRDGIEQ